VRADAPVRPAALPRADHPEHLRRARRERLPDPGGEGAGRELKRRNGYSELEIAQKREALENVLVPYRLEENKELLRGQGFRHVDVFFKWYNFCAIVAMK
jgi:hypothetical protein